MLFHSAGLHGDNGGDGGGGGGVYGAVRIDRKEADAAFGGVVAAFILCLCGTYFSPLPSAPPLLLPFLPPTLPPNVAHLLLIGGLIAIRATAPAPLLRFLPATAALARRRDYFYVVSFYQYSFSVVEKG